MPTGRATRTKTYKRSKIGFYTATVHIPRTVHIPPIPTVIDGKLIFPVGTFVANISNKDIETLDKIGAQYTIHEGIYWRTSDFLFNNYINELYTIKEQAQQGTVDYVIAKLEMNSLYGKFGMRREREQVVYCDNLKTALMKKLTPYYEDLGLYKKDVISENKYIMPHYSAYITSLARNYLYNEMLKVGLANIYYCDTDSLIVDKEIKTSEKLGDWKLEAKIKKGVFLQPKAYALQKYDNKEIIKAKGLRFNDDNITLKDYELVLKTNRLDIIRAHNVHILGYKENLNINKTLKINKKLMEKKLKNAYNKRIIKGNETEPILLKGEEKVPQPKQKRKLKKRR